MHLSFYASWHTSVLVNAFESLKEVLSGYKVNLWHSIWLQSREDHLVNLNVFEHFYLLTPVLETCVQVKASIVFIRVVSDFNPTL